MRRQKSDYVIQTVTNALRLLEEFRYAEQLAGFVFHPGLSTAASVSEISGRGVGMDAVRATLEALGGAVEFVTQPGLGTTTTLTVPITAAVQRVLLLEVAGECIEASPGPGDLVGEVMLLQQTNLDPTDLAFANPAKAEASFWMYEALPSDGRTSFTTDQGERCAFDLEGDNYPYYVGGESWPAGDIMAVGDVTIDVEGGPGPIVLEETAIGSSTGYFHRMTPPPIVISLATGGTGGCTGTLQIPLPIPLDPALCGGTLSSQCFGLCPQAPFGTFVSNCLSWQVTGS